jgi:death-on-curing protein
MTADHPAAVAEDAPTVRYLTIEDVLHIVMAFDTGSDDVGVRDMGLLIGAVTRPSLAFEGRDVYPTMAAKAAALLESIAGHAPLISGNKRLAWLATGVFLELNRVAVEFEDHEVVTLLREVSKGVISTDELTERLARRMGPWPPPPPGRRRRVSRAASKAADAAVEHPRRPGQPRHP